MSDAATIAARLAAIFGAVSPPSGESAVALATHELPDELKEDELPAVLVWPPEEVPVIQSGVDRGKQTYPVVLYLGRQDKTTQDRVVSLYAWREAVRHLPEVVSAHLSLPSASLDPLPGIAAAGGTKVTVNDPADTMYAEVLYDTVRVDVGVVLEVGGVQWLP